MLGEIHLNRGNWGRGSSWELCFWAGRTKYGVTEEIVTQSQEMSAVDSFQWSQLSVRKHKACVHPLKDKSISWVDYLHTCCAKEHSSCCRMFPVVPSEHRISPQVTPNLHS